MKISCMKGKLMQGISNVSKAVSTKTTHPILSCIFIEAENGNINLTANDMEIGIESYVEGTVIEEGKVAIEAKLLSDIVRRQKGMLNFHQFYNLAVDLPLGFR